MAFNVMELFAKIGLDQKDFNSGLDSAKSALGKFGSTVGKVGGAALKTTGVALTAAATGVIALTKQSYSAYSEYQQMVGGVQKLYGNMGMSLEDYAAAQGKTSEQVRTDYERNAEAEKILMNNAKNAFKTSSMSANQYMEMATQFSASLISSLGGDTKKAAEQTDVAMRAISDNWNTFGGDIGMIQGAFQGFAKQNYTMLDNLKLGYGGTKKEMERLIEDANEYAKSIGLAGDLSIESFSDIVSAVDLIQQKQKIANTTVREGATTISGSFGAMKAAWENLVTGFSDPDADLGQLISDFVTTGTTAIKNMVPTIVQALKGIGQAVTELIPIISEELPGLIEDLLPPILEAATQLVQTLASNLPQILDVIVQQIPTILPPLIQATIAIVSALAAQLPTILEMIGDVLITEVPKLIESIKNNTAKITSGISKILQVIGKVIIKLVPVLLPAMLDLAVQLLKALADDFSKNADQIVSGILDVVFMIVDTLTNPDTLMTIFECALKIILALAEGILNNLDKVLESVGALIVNITTFLVEAIPELVEEVGKNGAKIITEVIPNLLIRIGEAGGELLGKIIETISGWWKDIFDGASSVFSNIGGGLLDAWDYIKQKVGEFGELVWGGIKGVFSGMWEFGKEIGTNIWEGIKSMWGKLKDALNPVNWFKGSSLISDEMKEKMKEQMKNYGAESAEGYVKGQREGFDINSPSKKMRWIGQMVMEGYTEGLEDKTDGADIFGELSAPDLSSDITGSTNVVSSFSDSTTRQMASLFDMIKQYMEAGVNISVPVFIGNEQVDEMYVNTRQRIALRSGGQVDA